MKCIDVSEFQGRIDWNRVKADGIEGVIIRAGYGKGNMDDGFIEHIKGAIDAGLHVGIYWFSYAYNDDMATREAEHCIDVIRPFEEYIDMPIFFDWEYDSMNYAEKQGVHAGKELISTMTRAFCERIEKEGFTAGYYLNLDYSINFYNEEILADYKRWWAYYNAEPAQECYLWQNTSKGKVKGIKGNVDMDVLFGSLCPRKGEVEDLPSDSTEGQEEAHNESESYYKIGETYTVDVNTALNVRRGAGTDFDLVGYAGLTPDGKKHANAWGALLDGTRVTCLDIVNRGDETWMQIPSGWICAKSGNTRYVI